MAIVAFPFQDTPEAGAVIAWTNASGTYYTEDDTTNLAFEPAGTSVSWGKIGGENGIKYGTGGFIPVGDVTVAGDITPPTVSNRTITVSNVAETTLTLSWTKATDDITAATALKYSVYQSTSNNISTVAECTLNGGTPLNGVGGTADIDTLNVTGLVHNTTYYFNVVVEDVAGNKTAYTMASQKTNETVTATVDITGRTVSEIQAAITASLTSFNDVTVTGSKTDAASGITLAIAATKTVNWTATYTGTTSGLITLTESGGGIGTFKVGTNGAITGTSNVISSAADNAKITVDGGSVTATASGGILPAINATGAGSAVTVTSGAVNGGNIIGIAVVANSTIAVQDGVVDRISGGANAIINVSGGTVGYIYGDTDSAITVSGTANVTAASGYAINTLGSVEVTGGSVSSAAAEAIRTDNANFTVTVSGGTVESGGVTHAIHMNTAPANAATVNVTISGTTTQVKAAGSGYAISTNGSGIQLV